MCSREHTASPPLIGLGRASSQATGLQGRGGVLPSFTCMLLTVSPPSCIAVSSVASAHSLLNLNVRAAFSYEDLWSEVKCARPPAHHPYEQVTLHSAQRRKTKTLDFIFYPGSIFISQELLMGSASDTFHVCPKLCLKFCSKTPFPVSVGMAPKT